ncbi:MAG: 3-oxoacyl-ACP synthase III family protein [Parcubacteria group bacterium]|nr:3-oxoacyl-ACP synthase III family protein [Parcubacteria group bacterium]
MCKRVRIAGTGSFIPKEIYTNEEMVSIVKQKNSEWIYKNLGIKERRFAGRIESLIGTADKHEIGDLDMAYFAALEAIKDADLKPDEIDGLWYVTCTQDLEEYCHFSRAAIELHSRLELSSHAFAFEIDSGCGGTMQAIGISNDMIKGDDKINILVVASNKPSGQFNNLDSYIKTGAWLSAYVFGDGAGAMILQRSLNGKTGIIATYYGADGSHPLMYYHKKSGADTPVYEIDAKAVKELFPALMKRSLNGLMKKYSFELDEVKRFYFHQANYWVLKSFANFLEVPFERVAVNVDKYGNLSAASTLVLLNEDRRNGIVKENDLVLFCAVGAGAHYGAFLVRL